MKKSTAQMSLEALETAKNGLLWYADAHPVEANGCDDEAIAQIDKAIAALEAGIAQPVEPVGTVVALLGCVAIDWAGKCPRVGTQLYTAPQEPAVNAELLEALGLLLNYVEEPCTNDRAHCVNKSRVAISKATGGAA